MINMPKTWDIETEYKDIQVVNTLRECRQAAIEENRPELATKAEEGIRLCARDHARTPMQWDSSPQAGFSTNEKTWMKVMDSYVDINAESQVSD